METLGEAVVLDGVRMPTLLYGTAWKEDRTATLTEQALRAGFRGIDTANQRKHYHEAGVGAGIQAAGIPRNDLFLQTKFTFRGGQDHRLPYEEAAPVTKQVAQSVARSLQHLGTDHLDAYVLHGPSQSLGLGDADWDAWHAMETAHRSGQTRLLGISNVNADQLDELVSGAVVRPRVVQNRCFTRPHADSAVRALCAEHGIAYEGFSLLTGHSLVRTPHVAGAASRLECTAPQAVFAYCLARGIVVLTGTTAEHHMAQDLDVHALRLTNDELATFDRIVGAA